MSLLDDEEDDDFNPDEFINELLEHPKDETQFGIISKKEARDLHYDALEMFNPEPTIRLEENVTPKAKIPTDESSQSIQLEEVVEYVPMEPEGFNIPLYTKLVTQLHAYVQILGQSIIMGMG